MKKLLISAAVCGLALSAAPANAQVKLDLGGYFQGYAAMTDHDEVAGEAKPNDFDFLRNTEVHMGGETTLDNGLTVGAHMEMRADGTSTDANDSFDIDESYVYFASSWGRFNFGDEDGAAYLLQVAAPSADENHDGIRQYVQPWNYSALLADTVTLDGTATAFTGTGGSNFVEAFGGLDYDQDPTGKVTKLTYLSPIFSGFQVGVTYAPDSDASSDDLDGVGFEDVEEALGTAYEFAARWEAMFNNVGVILGGGWSHVELESETAIAALDMTDDRVVWNLGADFDVGPFGFGVSYNEDDHGDTENEAVGGLLPEEETWVVGVDYTTGPFKLGASYYDATNTFGISNLDTQRYAAGVTYTYGPGMTFRGSVSYVEHESKAGSTTANIGGTGDDSTEGTAFLLGTQINF